MTRAGGWALLPGTHKRMSTGERQEGSGDTVTYMVGDSAESILLQQYVNTQAGNDCATNINISFSN